jgi:hypothetical protein
MRRSCILPVPSSSRGITPRVASSENGFRRWHRRWARLGPTCSKTNLPALAQDVGETRVPRDAVEVFVAMRVVAPVTCRTFRGARATHGCQCSIGPGRE